MKVEKINESLYLTNVDSSAQASDVKKEAMFAAEFNSDDGIQLEKHSETQDNTPKTYTKKSKDADGNDVILTYRSKDDSLISREIKYSYGDTRTEFIKAGTSIVEKAEEKNSDGAVILQEIYYTESPFGKKEAEELDPETGELISMAFYENGEELPYFKTDYDDGYKIETTYLYGEPEETIVYRADGSVERHTKSISTNEGKRYENTKYRKDGTVFSHGIFADPYEVMSVEETSYAFDGKTVKAKKYTGKDSRTYFDNYNDDGSVRVREISDSGIGRMKERIVYDENGEIFISTKYGANGEITEYYKNPESVANKPFQEKLLNGKLDTSFKQGQAGTCYIASVVRSLVSTEKGREVLSKTIKYDDSTDTATITFKGANKEYSFTKEEIAKAMGRLGTGDPDFTAFLLGYEQYRTEELHQPIDSGSAVEVVQVLTGKECDSNIMFGMSAYDLSDDILNKLQKQMETKQMMVTAGTPPRDLYTEFSEKDNEMGLANSHAYCIKQITGDSVYLIEPTTDKEIVLSREMFLDKFISFFAVDL